MGKTIIIIPAYNEEETIAKLIERSKKYADICIVNDGSKDRTSEIVQSYKDVIQIRHEKNMHIPQTIRDGMIYAYNNNYDYVITMDAGLSHLPEELPLFIKYPHCDMLVGYRELIIDVPLHRRIISKIGTLFINMAISKFSYKSFSTPFFKDITSGYRRYSKKAIDMLLNKKMHARSFDFHSEAFMLLFRNGLSIKEIPITYIFTNSSLSLKVIMDSVWMLYNMFFFRKKWR